jgi:uncharacterized membrane protein YdbT with pleckstrin-like domain
MSYVEDQLLPGEQIRHQARVHKLAYAVPILAGVALLLSGGWLIANSTPEIGAVFVAIGLIPFAASYIHYTSSEFAVTDKRVIIKVGFIQRRTLETLLTKVEGIGVDQSVLGRLLGYGTITVTGTGGTKEPFANIADPLEFRRQVQGQVTGADASMLAAAPREERDCPFCAERILARAKVCKHCGRDVA